MNTPKLSVVVAIFALVFAGIAMFKHDSPASTPVQQFGGVPTLDGVDNPYMSLNGNRTYFQNQPIMASSTRLCSIKNPLQATSTITELSVQITGSGILGANAYSISTSTTAFASSTTYFVLDHNIPTNSSDSMVWSPNVTATSRLLSSSADGKNNIIVLPNEYLNVNMATTTGAGALAAYYQGTCKGIWRGL